jgi:alcohol dehydrogenase class IV
MNTISQYMFKTSVYYGTGSTQLTGTEAVKAGINKALVVTDIGVRQAGLLKAVEDSLVKSIVKYEVFDSVQEDADVEVMHKITLQIKATGCNGIIVIGGGSPICAAKGAALEATNAVENVRTLAGWNKASIPPLPLICLPTTAGSGSDVSHSFPVFDPEHKGHFGIGGELVSPRVSILDPLLLVTCPHRPMIFGGIDALSHAVEALWGAQSTPYTDALAYESIYLIMTNLREATYTSNLEAKLNQQIGCTMAMNVGDNSKLGIIHGITGAYINLTGPHGYKCGVLLPHAIEFNMPVCENKFAKMAVMLGEIGHHKTTAELAHLFLRRVKQLLLDIGFPRKFDPSNLSQDRIPALLQEVRAHPLSFIDFNLRKVTDEDLIRIFEASVRDWSVE